MGMVPNRNAVTQLGAVLDDSAGLDMRSVIVRCHRQPSLSGVKILMVTNRLNVGGIEKNMVLLCEELSARGHEIHAASEPGVLVESFEAAGGKHWGLRGPGNGVGALLGDLRQVAGLLRVEQPDVAHVFSAWAAVVVFLAKHSAILRPRRSRPRLAVLSSLMGIVSSPSEPALKTWVRAWLTGLGADVLIAPSPAMLDLVTRLPATPRRVLTQTVVGVRMDPPRSAEGKGVRQILGLAPSDRLVVTIGRLDATKAHHLFIEAAEQACRQRNDVHFVIVGDGELKEALEARIRSAGVSSRVHLLGERQDVAEVLAEADVCVRPGVVEGFVGITVLEAQAQGVPVISFDTRDVRVAIEDGHSGVLVPQGDTGALAEAMTNLLNDPARARAIGEAGRVAVEEAFSLPRVVTRLEEVYADLARQRAG